MFDFVNNNSKFLSHGQQTFTSTNNLSGLFVFLGFLSNSKIPSFEILGFKFYSKAIHYYSVQKDFYNTLLELLNRLIYL